MSPQDEIDAILQDPAKTIEGEIRWSPDPQHAAAWTFYMPVAHSGTTPLDARATLRREANTLSYLLVLRGSGRIFGICWGYDHLNPSGEIVSGPHVHKWTSEHLDRWVEPFGGASAGTGDPILAWREFCALAHIAHLGEVHPPPEGPSGM